jgi:aryl-alcohol dehydrogenase-like predicted oxidoreductase
MTNKTLSIKRALGQTDILVTPIGLGTNKFSGGKGFNAMIFPDLPPEEMNGIIKTALDGGINWFDTAEMYGFGHSERAVAAGLRAEGKDDDDVVIATKWSPMMRSAGNIRKSIDKRITALDGYMIDLYMVHNPYGFSSPEAEMEAMADLVASGKIRAVGVSNFSEKQMRRAHAALEKRGLPLAVNQVQFSLMNRKMETNGVLDAAKELGITIIAWAPLGSGVLTGKYQDPERYKQVPFGRKVMVRRDLKHSRPLLTALEGIARRHNATPSQIALNWVVSFHGEAIVAIPGASATHHAAQAAGSMNIRLTDEELTGLDVLSRGYR